MRRLCVAILALLALPLVVSANEKRQGYCQQQSSGTRVTACTVTVYVSGTLTKALLFADLLNTPKANPFVADPTTGLWSFYATNGHYDVAFSGGSPSINPPYTVTDLLSLDLISTPLTPGNCLQADVNGFITSTSGPCGIAAGVVSATGSPQIGNLTAFSSPTSITNTNLSGDVTTSGSSATTLSSSIGGSHTFTSTLTQLDGLASSFDGTFYIGDRITSWGVSDLGAQANAAYTACPAAPSACRIVNMSTTPQSYSTTISFQVKGKYALLEAIVPCIVTVNVAFGGCLNYTTSSGAAVIADFYDPAAANPPTQIGFRNIGFINNGCTTAGGCGSTADGILVGSTNGGIANSVMDRVSIYGFGIGYVNTNASSTNVHWVSPFFQANVVAKQLGSVREYQTGGIYANNGQLLVAASSSAPNAHWDLVTYFGNITLPVIDYTAAAASGAYFSCDNCHGENGSSTSVDIKFIAGNVDIQLTDGTLKDDSTSGTGSWFVSSSGSYVSINGTAFKAGRTVTQVVQLLSPARGTLNVVNSSPSFITTIAGGADAVNVNGCTNVAGTGNSTGTCALESPITFNGALTLNAASSGTGVQGTDTKLLTAGTVSGTGSLLCSDANGGATTSSCTVIPLSPSRVAVSGSISSGSATTLGTRSVTMPSNGCPCRVLAVYNLYVSSSGSGQGGAAWVSDGSNVFSGSAAGQSNGSSGAAFDLHGAEISPVTYANGANVTFTLFAQATFSGLTVNSSPFTGSGPGSGFQVTVFPSN